jgi:hypothetical protein
VGTTPEELVDDIARHRENLGAALDAIEDRMRPRSILRRNQTALVVVLAAAGGLVGWLLSGRRAG